MAEALSDDVELNTNASVSVQVNYPGPKSDTQYPLSVQYCGGESHFLCLSLAIALVQSLPQNALFHSNTVNTVQVNDRRLARPHRSPFIADPERCREWLERTLPDLLSQMQASSNAGDDKSGEKKRQTRGGKGMPKGKKKFEAQKIVVSKQQRKGNKYVTIIQGLASNGTRTSVRKIALVLGSCRGRHRIGAQVLRAEVLVRLLKVCR